MSTARAEAERLAEAEKIVEFEGYLPFPYCQWILERYKAASEENERLRKEVAAFESWKKAELVPRSELCDRAENAEDEVVSLTERLATVEAQRDQAIRGHIESGDIQVHGMTLRQVLEVKHLALTNGWRLEEIVRNWALYPEGPVKEIIREAFAVAAEITDEFDIYGLMHEHGRGKALAVKLTKQGIAAALREAVKDIK